MIIIYQDYVHNTGGLYKTLSAHFGAANVTYADADMIIGGILSPDIKAFCMPGGATRYVAAKLNGAGNQAIRNYVEQGGLYVGLCAGAYYACRRTEWHPPHGPSIVVENELNFYPVTAHGPIAPFTRNELDMEYTAAKVDLLLHDNTIMPTFYHGGPLLGEVTDQSSYDVLARYADLLEKPVAVVTGPIGKGRFILSSPHLEIDSAQLELETFDVVANRCADIAAMPDHSGISTDYFISLLNRFIA